MSKKEWSNNAELRYVQVLSGKDLTFSQVFLPIWKKLFDYNKFSRVIEIGTGPGILTKELIQYTNEIISMDINSEMIDTAIKFNNHKNITFMCQDVMEFDSNEKFQCCFSHMVFHNIDEIEPIILRIGSLLEKQGSFIFTIPHPCFYHLYKSDEMPNFEYNNEKKYLIDFTISMDRVPLPNKISYYHRTLETYITILEERNFNIKQVKEVFPEKNVMKAYPQPWEYPRYIIFHAVLDK